MALSLIMIFAVASMVGQIQGLQNHEFRLGTDATVSISFRVNGKHRYCYEIYSIGRSEPFCINGTVDPDALRPDQRNRFKVNGTLSQQILTMELHISNIQKSDEGVYIWALKEHLESGDRVATSDVYLGIIIPPGRSECSVEKSPYSVGLKEVHCRAAVGSDGGGQLVCYQKDVKTPFQNELKISSTYVTAVFWMDTKRAIQCCSYEVNYEKVPGECNDFTQTAFDKSDGQIAATTGTNANKKTSTVIRTTPYHGQTTTEIFDSSQYAITNGDTISTYVVYKIVIGIIVVILLIAIAIIILLLICLWLKGRRHAREKAARAKQAPKDETTSMLTTQA